MNDKIKSNSSLLLAYQQDSSTIPSDFSISCLLPTKPKGIFESSFYLDKMVICGTNQGPIILTGLNKKENKFQRVSLLCGNSYRITDIKETLQGDNFLSISSNCTICLWSLYDGSCLFYLDLSLPINEYKLSISPSGPSHIWIWAPGSNLYLFDLDKEQITYSLSIEGLTSFSILSPHISYCVTSTYAICSTVSKLITYTINNDQTLSYSSDISKPVVLNQAIKACQRGLIRYNVKSGKWSIIRPTKPTVILSGIFKLDDDELISDVNWSYISFFCIATFKARFLIVSMKKSSDLNSNTSSIQIVSRRIIESSSFSSQFSFCILDKNEIAFSPDSKTVVALSEKSELILKPKKSKRQFNIVESDFSKPYVVYSNGKSTISFYNAEIRTSDSQRYTFDGKITTIYVRNSNISNSLQIINGYDDGHITFWTVGTSVDKAISVCALSSPINSLIEPPFKISGRQLLLAISKTECCMFKATDLNHIFNLGSTFAILAVYYIKNTMHLVFALSNSLFVVCDITEPDPIHVHSQLPTNSILLYSNFFSFFIENITSIVCLKLSNRSLWYQFLDISSIHRFNLNNKSNKQVINSLNIIDQMISENSSSNPKNNLQIKNEIDSDNSTKDSENKIEQINISQNSSSFSNNSLMEIINQNESSSDIKSDSNSYISSNPNIEDIGTNNTNDKKSKITIIQKDDDRDKVFSSLVLIGKQMKPTFFYPHFSVNLESILYASPNIAAKHFLIKRLIAKMKLADDTSYQEDSKRFVDFVPILIKLMYETPQDSQIQQICAESCASLNFLVTFIKAQNLVSPLLMTYQYKDISQYSDHELLMLSLFTSRYDNLIPSEMLPNLLVFLIDQQNKSKSKSSAISAMSTFILIDGIHIWTRVLREQPISISINKSDGDLSNISATISSNSSSSSIGSNNSLSSAVAKKKKEIKDKKNDEKLYLSIIRSVIINKNDFKFLYDRFLSYVYSEDIDLLVKILPKFVEKCYTETSVSPIPSPIAIPIPPSQYTNKIAEAALELYSEMEMKNDELLGGWLSVAIASVGQKFSNLAKKAYSLIIKHSKYLPYIDAKNKILMIGTSSGFVYIYNDLKLKSNVKLFNDRIENVSIGPNEECGLAISKFDHKMKIFKIKAASTIIHEMDIFKPPDGTKFSIRWLKNDNASISFVPI